MRTTLCLVCEGRRRRVLWRLRILVFHYLQLLEELYEEFWRCWRQRFQSKPLVLTELHRESIWRCRPRFRGDLCLFL